MSDLDPRIAPPPPPRLGSLAESSQGGFQTTSTRSWLEGLVIVAFILLVGLGVTFGGGKIAAALLPLVPRSFDHRLGEVLSTELPFMAQRCSDPAAEEYVRTLAAPLLKAMGASASEYEFRVSPDPTPNAFALPGGFITVHFGLLEAARTGDEVALVLAHEIEHVVHRHATRRALRQMSGMVLLGVFLGSSDLGSWVSKVGELSGRGYDRAEEAQADLDGARLAARAGIRPSALGEFMARLSSHELELPAWLGDHPATDDRVRIAESVPFSGPGLSLPAPAGLTCHPASGGP